MTGELALLHNYLVIGAVLFGLGAIGLLTRRNMIVMFLAVEMMLQGVSLSLVAWGRYHNDFGGQVFAMLIIAVAACEAAIALAMVLMLFHRKESLDIALWQELREDDQPASRDHKVLLEAPEEAASWPCLTPAGIRPEPSPEQTGYRPHV